MLQRPSKTMGIQWSCSQTLDTYIAATTTRTGHPPSHSNTPLHTPLVGDDSEDLGSSQDLDLLQVTLYPQADTGQVEGPNTLTKMSQGHLPNSLWHLLKHHLKQHKSALTSGNTAQSAMAEHAVDQMHAINWNRAEVVAFHPTTTRDVH